MDSFIAKTADENTGKASAKLQIHAFWWKGRHGDEKPSTFHKSSDKVLSNLKSDLLGLIQWQSSFTSQTKMLRRL